jgi:hypothetical protein
VVLFIVLSPPLFLATPGGQRWAIRQAVTHLDRLLPAEAKPTRVSVGGVGISRDPLGISLQDVRWSLKEGPPDDALVDIGSLEIQPTGWTLQSWNRIHLDGVHVHAGLSDWIQTLSSGQDGAGDEANIAPLQIDRLDLEDIRLDAPATWTPGQPPAQGVFTAVAVDALSWDGAALTWSQLTAEGAADGQWDGVPVGLAMSLSGSPDALSINLRDASPAPGLGLPLSGSSSLRWSRASATANLHRGEVDLRAAFDAASVDLRARWSPDSLWLSRVQAELTEGERVSPVLTGMGLWLEAVGAVTLAWSELGEAPDWGKPSLPAPVEWSASLISPAPRPTRASGRWTPASGHLSVDLDLEPDLGIPDHSVSLSLTGFLPEWTPGRLEDNANLQSTWDGRWTISNPLVAPGWTSGSGDLTLELGPTEDDRWSGEVELLGQCAPLSLSPSLELYGDIACRGEFTSADRERPARWWGHLDLVDARWIPKAGFGRMERHGAPLAMRRFSVQASGSDAVFSAELDGDFLVGTLEGPLNLEGWTGPIQSALASGGFAVEPPAQEWTDWSVDLTLLRDDLLERWSAGTRSVGPQSRITGSHVAGALETRVDLTALHHDDLRMGPTELLVSGGTSALHLTLDADSAHHARAGRLNGLTLDATVSADTRSRILLDWDAALAGHIDLEHVLGADREHAVRLKEVALRHDSGPWNLGGESAPLVQWMGEDWRGMTVEEFILTGPLGRVRLHSDVPGNAATPPLTIDVDGLPTEALTAWASTAAYLPIPSVSGTLNGKGRVDLSTFNASAALQWQDAQLPPYRLGDLCLDLRVAESIMGTLQQFVEEREVLVAAWDSQNQVRLDLADWPLDLLNPLLNTSGVVMDGTANGRLDVSLDTDVPQANGSIALLLPEVTVEATGGRHAVEGALNLAHGFIGMDQARVTDPQGHVALLNLSILHEDYAQWNYDLGFDIEAEPFQVMDLAPGADRLFHGTVFATGQLDVSGDGDGVAIETRIRSASGTRFTLPLDALEGTDIPSGIRFVGGSAPAPPPEPASPFDLSLSLGIEVTPDAELALILDGRSGERVDGRASGVLTMSQSPSLPLTIQGGLDIVEGQYRFSLRDLFTKRIDIAPGGRIDWDGDPYAAELDLLAFSSLRANPSPIVPTIARGEKTLVDVGMGIRGALEAPRLDFALTFPEYEARDPASLAEVQAALATREETERQTFALLATGQFIPAGAQGGFLSQTAAAQASELVSTRISEWLSSLSDDVDIGFRYVPPTAGSTEVPDGGVEQGLEEAIELDLGLSLLNDRLTVSGSIGTSGMEGFNLNGTEFRGGLDVRYRLTPDGRWELQAYQIPESPLEQNAKQGIGAAYQIRFDRLRELLRSGSR